MTLHDLLHRERLQTSALPTFVARVDEIRGVRVLRLCGDVGQAIGGEIEESNERGEGEGAFDRPLILDFGGTTRTDFSTVSYLVYALRRRMRSSAGLGLINQSPELKAQIEMAKLDDVLHCYADESSALEALSGRAG